MQRTGYYGYLEQKYSQENRKEWKTKGGRIKIWTDGSARQTANGYKAGAGIFYGTGNERNRGWAVSGNPTNQRGELTAFLRCIEREEREVEIHTDSMYVAKGVALWRHGWKAKAWYRKPGKARYVDNADLWMKVDTIMESRGDRIKVKWVKGHGMPFHIRCGLTTENDIWGNNEADRLAGKAAEETEIGGMEELVDHE